MLKSLVCWLLLTVTAFNVGAAGEGARVDEVSPADARAVRAVVEAQLKALAADNAVLAFSYATPALRSQFGSADNFMAMVRQSYPMVIRPVATSFYQPQSNEDSVFQGVLLRDREGRSWRATYLLKREADKRWRIHGCAVAPEDERSST